MTNVREWLDSFGLGQCSDTFEKNAIEALQLPELDHEVLLAVGVKAAGHRMKILKAAAELASQSAHAEAGDTASAAPSTAVTSTGEAERHSGRLSGAAVGYRDAPCTVRQFR
ncbi:MAG: hypothetical protein ACI9W2_001901 [Gammaproteobacteria bacterium]|jgi:hypothetical protein